MESGSVVIHRGGKDKRYDICIEDYVLSYLKQEADSMELSEIFFYGFRKDAGRKLLVYGAGRGKGIAAFGEYEPLEELMCRLTQAGPVFMVREANGTYEVNGFKIFYANNEAMQKYLLEWREGSRAATEKGGQGQIALPPLSDEEKKRAPHGAMSLQLGLVLLLLVAIVISSTNSYDKMEQLNRSAKEVFFAIENQEAEQSEEMPEDPDRQSKTETEIVVERDTDALRSDDGQEGDVVIPGAGQEAENAPEEGILKQVSEEPAESSAQREETAEEASAEQGEEKAKQEEKEEQTQAAATQSDEDNTEALSRSVTRYYEVEQGDTLYTISQKIYGDSSRVEKICEMNEIADPDRIRSGQKIILP